MPFATEAVPESPDAEPKPLFAFMAMIVQMASICPGVGGAGGFGGLFEDTHGSFEQSTGAGLGGGVAAGFL
jgi:hypothetical protein